jgi:antitoxin PrlF
MNQILEHATLTSKGQITLPKAIRQALGVGVGEKLSFEWNGFQVVVRRAEAPEHEDPAIKGLLTLLEQEIADGRNLNSLPPELLEAMESALGGECEQDDEIEGPVAL